MTPIQGVPIMKWIGPALLFATVAAGCGHKEGQHAGSHGSQPDAHAGHKAGAAHAKLMVKTDPAEVKALQPTTLNLMIHGADGSMVRNFEKLHGEKVHLIVVREGLDQFAHIHPEVDAAGNLKATFAFPMGGSYRLFADFQPVGQKPAVADGTIEVAGDAAPAPKLTPNVPGNVMGDGLNAVISVSNLKVGGETAIGFELQDGEGKGVADLQPYLGALGHLVIISADGGQYVHAHPEKENAASGTVAFGAHFTQRGIHKGWGQFQRAGKVLIVPFVIDVK